MLSSLSLPGTSALSLPAASGADVIIASRKLEHLEAADRAFAVLPGKIIPVACYDGCQDHLQSGTKQF